MRRQPEPEQWAAIALFGLVCLGLCLVGCAGESKTAGPRPTLLVFTSPACYGCVQDYPVVEKIASMGLATVKIITAEQSPNEMEQWGVEGLPTYILILDGRELYRTHQAELARRRILRLYRCSEQTAACVTMFSAKWCGKCQSDKKVLSPNVSVVDVDEFPNTATYWSITRLPTYIISYPTGQIVRTSSVYEANRAAK